MKRMLLFASVSVCSACALFQPGAAQPQETKRPSVRFYLALAQPRDGFTPRSDDQNRTLYIAPQPELTEGDVVSATTLHGAQQSIIRLTLTRVGGERLEQLTRDNVGAQLAIFVDERLVSAPRIRDPITGNEVVISGDFSRAKAEQIAAALNATQEGRR